MILGDSCEGVCEALNNGERFISSGVEGANHTESGCALHALKGLRSRTALNLIFARNFSRFSAILGGCGVPAGGLQFMQCPVDWPSPPAQLLPPRLLSLELLLQPRTDDNFHP